MIVDGLIKIVLPANQDEILLWSQIICLWMFSNYVIGNDPAGKSAIQRRSKKSTLYLRGLYRISFFSIVSLLLPGLNFKQITWRILVGLIFAAFSTLLPVIRNGLVTVRKGRLNRFTAEWEFIANGLFITIIGYVIARSSLHVYSPDSLITLPISPVRLSVAFLTTAGAFFLLDGGTQLTRGILFKTGTAPENIKGKEKTDTADATQESTIDRKEYNRGKYIGNLERLLVLTVVLLGSYETIGFIIAGKGLIRAKELEDRDFAEYFLIGTLTSTAIAVLVGLLIRLAIKSIDQR